MSILLASLLLTFVSSLNISCPTNAPCEIQCGNDTSKGICMNATIDATNSSYLSVKCVSNASCSMTSVICPISNTDMNFTNNCTISCLSDGSCSQMQVTTDNTPLTSITCYNGLCSDITISSTDTTESISFSCLNESTCSNIHISTNKSHTLTMNAFDQSVISDSDISTSSSDGVSFYLSDSSNVTNGTFILNNTGSVLIESSDGTGSLLMNQISTFESDGVFKILDVQGDGSNIFNIPSVDMLQVDCNLGGLCGYFGEISVPNGRIVMFTMGADSVLSNTIDASNCEYVHITVEADAVVQGLILDATHSKEMIFENSGIAMSVNTISCPRYAEIPTLCQMECNGNQSCANMDVYTNKSNELIVYCIGEGSCMNTHIYNDFSADTTVGNALRLTCTDHGCETLGLSGIDSSELYLQCNGPFACDSLHFDVTESPMIKVYVAGDVMHTTFNAMFADTARIYLLDNGVFAENNFLGNYLTESFTMNATARNATVRGNRILALNSKEFIVHSGVNAKVFNNSFIGESNHFFKMTSEDLSETYANEISCGECAIIEYDCNGICGSEQGETLLNADNAGNVVVTVTSGELQYHRIETRFVASLVFTGSYSSTLREVNINAMNADSVIVDRPGTMKSVIVDVSDAKYSSVACQVDCVDVSIYASKNDEKTIIKCSGKTKTCNSLSVYSISEAVTDNVTFEVTDCGCQESRGNGCSGAQGVSLYCGASYNETGTYMGKSACVGDCCGDIVSEFTNANCSTVCAAGFACPVSCTGNTCDQVEIDARLATSVDVLCLQNSTCEGMSVLCPMNQTMNGETTLCSLSCQDDGNSSCDHMLLDINGAAVVTLECYSANQNSTPCASANVNGANEGSEPTVNFLCLGLNDDANWGSCSDVTIENNNGSTNVDIDGSRALRLKITADQAKSLEVKGTNGVLEASYVKADMASVVSIGRGVLIKGSKIYANEAKSVQFDTSESILNSYIGVSEIPNTLSMKFSGGGDADSVVMNNSIFAQNVKSVVIQLEGNCSFEGNEVHIGNSKEVLISANSEYAMSNNEFYALTVTSLSINVLPDSLFDSNTIEAQTAKGVSVTNNGYFEGNTLNAQMADSVFVLVTNGNGNASMADSMINATNAGQVMFIVTDLNASAEFVTVDAGNAGSLSVVCAAHAHDSDDMHRCDEVTLYVPAPMNKNEKVASLLCSGYGCNTLNLYTVNGADDLNITGTGCKCDDDVKTACIDEWEIYCEKGNGKASVFSKNECDGECCGTVIDMLHIDECEWPSGGGGGSSSNTGAIVGGVCGAVVGILLIAGGIYWFRKRKMEEDDDAPLLVND